MHAETAPARAPQTLDAFTSPRVSVPLVLQLEPVECGAACLAMILGYHGQHVPLDRLRVETGVSRDGSNAMNIVIAARERGMEAAGFRMPVEGFRTAQYPCIVFWENNHFVVVERVVNGKVQLADPAHGKRRVDLETFTRSYSGVVLDFKPGESFAGHGSALTLATRLRPVLRGARSVLPRALLAGAAGGVTLLGVAAGLRWTIDTAWTWRTESEIGWLVAALGVLGVCSAGLAAVQTAMLNRAALRAAVADSGRIVWRALRLDPEFYRRRSPVDVAWRILDHEHTAGELSRAAAAVGALLASGIAGAALILISPWLGLLLLTLCALGVMQSSLADPGAWQRDSVRQGRLRSFAGGVTRSLESIKAGSREPEVLWSIIGLQGAALASAQELECRAATAAALGRLTLGVGTASAIAWTAAGWHAVSTPGALASILVLYWSVHAGASSAAHAIGRLPRLLERWRAVEDVLEVEPQVTGPVAANTVQANLSVRRLSGFLELRDVSFGFSRREPPLLRDISISISPGDRVAIVGPSGSGKSTLARLICGLHEPWTGQILFDHLPREEHRRSRMANSVAMAQRDGFFIEGTIRDNLSLWDRTLRDDAIQRAAKDAMAHDVITSRRGAFAARVEAEGRNFSGGQRQRLQIARALAVDPTILILDEATSMLDTPTELSVLDAIRRRGCACLIITHRLASVRDCGQICVMDAGRIVSRGTHQELLAHSDLYRRLWEEERAG